MTRARIAPRLRWFVDNAATEDIKADWVAADRELRALLAVARAAERFRSLDPMAQALLLGDDNAIDRALARLRKVSGAKGLTR